MARMPKSPKSRKARKLPTCGVKVEALNWDFYGDSWGDGGLVELPGCCGIQVLSGFPTRAYASGSMNQYEYGEADDAVRFDVNEDDNGNALPKKDCQMFLRDVSLGIQDILGADSFGRGTATLVALTEGQLKIPENKAALKENGFVALGKRFHNPNTDAFIQMFVKYSKSTKGGIRL